MNGSLSGTWTDSVMSLFKFLKHARLVPRTGRWCVTAAVMSVWGCLSAGAGTDFILPLPTDPSAAQTAVSARNFDTDYNLRYFAEVMPRGRVWHATDPDAAGGKLGLTWTNQYGFVGISYGWAVNYNQGHHVDGMNEAGLSAALLDFDSANGQFQPPAAGASNLSIQLVVAWALGNFATVEQASSAIQYLVTWQENTDYFLTFTNALHLVLHDTNSHTAVVEWTPSGPTVYGTIFTDAMRVTAGDPSYASQMGIAVNYTNLNWANHLKIPTSNELVSPSDQYLPGDSWSPSRFVRANRLVHNFADSYLPLANTQYPPYWRLQTADHILRRLEIMPGERKRYPDSPSSAPAYLTVLSLLRDHSHRDLIFRGLYDANYKKIHVERLDFVSPTLASPWMELDPLPEYALTAPLDLSGTLAAADAYYYLWGVAVCLKLSVTINTFGGPDDILEGKMYIFSQKTNGNYYAWNGSAWSGPTHLTNMVTCFSGTLGTKTFKTIYDDYVTSNILLGTKVYAGYGRSPLEMLMAGRYRLVHMVSNPYSLLSK